MNILIDIGHPANLLFVKNFTKEMKSRGHEILFTTRDKEVTIQLFDYLQFKYVLFGKPFKTIIGKMFGVLKFEYLLLKESLKFKPDVFFGHCSIYPAHISFLLGKPCISFHANDGDPWWVFAIIKPFIKIYLTPLSFKKKLGKKQILYKGNHELAYIHPRYFKPNPGVLINLNLSYNEKFILLRFVSWKAIDDFGKTGFDDNEKRKIVHSLLGFGRVFISSEEKLPEDLQKYTLTIEPHQMQDVEYYASLIFTESGSMASESALMGTPVIYYSSKKLGFIEEYENHGLLYSMSILDKAIKKAQQILQMSNNNELYKKRSKNFLNDKIDVTAFMVWFIEEYPISVDILKKNPDYQNRFK